MKNLIRTALILFILPLALSSCKKEIVDKYESSNKATAAVAKTTAEVKAPANFKWTTNQTISMSFKAIATDARVAVLKVTATDGTMIYQKLQKANEDFTASFEIPSSYDKVNVQYAGTIKTFETKGGKVEMNLN